MTNWTRAAMLVCMGAIAGQLISQALAAVPYSLGGDTVADRVWADGGAGVEAFIATQGSFSSRAASGTKSHETTVNGARTDFGAGASDYCSSDGTTVTFAGPIAWPNATASSLDAGFVAAHGGLMLGNASITPSISGYSASMKEMMAVGTASTFIGSVQWKGMATAGGAETGMVIGNNVSLDDNQAFIQFRDGNSFSSAKRLEIMSTGLINMANADGGSAGNVTVNQPSGYAAIANGATSMVLTNSMITAASGLQLTLSTNDTTCLGLYFTRGAGTATIGCTNSANCSTAAGCNFFFTVIGPAPQ